MAWGRKKGGGRKEPQFGLAAALSELRLSPQDRIARDDETPKKSSSKRRNSDPEEDPPRERKPRSRRASGKRKASGRARGGLSRLFYWGAVPGLGAPIPVVGVTVWAGAHLPPIQALEIPK